MAVIGPGKRATRWWPWLLAGMLAGCAAPRPTPVPPPALKARVNYAAVPDKHLKHYSIAPSQTFIAPDPRPDNPAPAYPPDLVARGLPPVEVTALLIVDAEGRVREVRIVSESGDGPLQRRFDAAVRAAALHWHFAPLRIANWVTDANGDERRVGSTAKPFSQAYRFRFEVHDGKPRVIGAAPPVQR